MKKKIISLLFAIFAMTVLVGKAQALVFTTEIYDGKIMRPLPITRFYPLIIKGELFTAYRYNYNMIDNYDPLQHVALEFSFDPNSATVSNWVFKSNAMSYIFEDGYGFSLRTVGSSNSIPRLIIDFNRPLAFFGVNFIHASKETTDFAGEDFTRPARLWAYDGLHAHGKQIMGISDQGFLPNSGLSYHNLFVGIWSNEVNIQSVALSGTWPGYGFCVDDLAISTTATPEPSTLILFATGIAGAGWYGKKKRCCSKKA